MNSSLARVFPGPLARATRAIRRRLSPTTVIEPRRVPRVETFYWQSPLGVNFGDYLGSVIVQRMLATRELLPDEEAERDRRLLSVGSVLHFARNGDTIWGSGMNGKVPANEHTFDHLDVRAVRGLLTKRFLELRGVHCPETFGDPGLLVRQLLPQRLAPTTDRTPVCYVPNLHDRGFMEGWENVISPLGHWADVIRRIAASEHVISSSLHGLVVADAFGIPCTYLRCSETEGLFKYEDYVLGVGRAELKVTTSRSEAIRSSPLDPVTLRLNPLKRAFPFDLWASPQAYKNSSLPNARGGVEPSSRSRSES